MTMMGPEELGPQDGNPLSLREVSGLCASAWGASCLKKEQAMLMEFREFCLKCLLRKGDPMPSNGGFQVLGIGVQQWR